ncbi:F-box domain containing protein [Trema orientale]|uniref:F-box domain containing protein n=1 Tax=Trema orientale TaxID=63057 RepID=A0A2P5FD44_TREOI|nr:F-box domain containing protein [Trema orientale]
MIKSFLEWKPIRQLRVSFLSLMDSGVTCKLPCDIIEEILSRLDAKSLMRCSCVCKSWLSLIGRPSFKIRHLEHQTPCVLLHLDTPLENLGRFSFRSSESFDQIWSLICPIDMFNSSSWCLVGSQNGVICLYRYSDCSVHLWNPAINKHKKLPLSPPPPADSFPIHGFVYEPLTDDFKVVVVASCRRYNCVNFFKRGNQVGVYSFRSDSWKTMEMPDIFSDPSVITHPHRMNPVVVYGSIHWMFQYRRKSQAVLLESIGIVAFDPRTEIFKFINSPPFTEPDDVKIMCNWSGCLSLVTSDGHGLIEIWVMKKYCVLDSWTKHFSFDLVKHLPSAQGSRFHPIGLSDNGNLLLNLMYVQANDNVELGFDFFHALTFYHPKSNEVKHLCPGTSITVRQFTTYVESIFLS